MKRIIRILLIFSLSCPNLALSSPESSEDEWSELHQQAWEAIDAHDAEGFQKLFHKIDNPYIRHDKYKDTLLSHSITTGESRIAVWLLDQGIDPNDKSKQLPLINAVSRSGIYGDEMSIVIEKLLESGADVNTKGLWGKTALHQAKLADHGTVKLLLKNGADPKIQDKKGQTPLHLFAGHIGEVRTIKLLIDHGADASITDLKGDTALHRMIGHWIGEDSVVVADLLIAAGADPATTNNDGKTALDLLYSRKNPATFHELKQRLEETTR